MTKWSAAYRARTIRAGLCIACRKPRGERGTHTRCRPCAEEWNLYQQALRVRLRGDGVCRECRRPAPSGCYCDTCKRNRTS